MPMIRRGDDDRVDLAILQEAAIIVVSWCLRVLQTRCDPVEVMLAQIRDAAEANSFAATQLLVQLVPADAKTDQANVNFAGCIPCAGQPREFDRGSSHSDRRDRFKKSPSIWFPEVAWCLHKRSS